MCDDVQVPYRPNYTIPYNRILHPINNNDSSSQIILNSSFMPSMLLSDSFSAGQHFGQTGRQSERVIGQLCHERKLEVDANADSLIMAPI